MHPILQNLVSIFQNFNSLSFMLGLFAPLVAFLILHFKLRRDKNYKTYILVFLGGTLTVLPIFLYQLTYQHLITTSNIPDFVGTIKNSLTSKNVAYWSVLFYIFIALTEEFIKFFVVKKLDKRNPELITTINDALKLGIAAGLGFAFAENIKYFSDYTSLGLGTSYKGLITLFIGRTFITTIGHTMFTCIFTYYYGISKFAKDFLDFEKLQGKFVKPEDYSKFQKKYIFKGLILSMIIHALFNLSLEIPKIISNPNIPIQNLKTISQLSAIGLIVMMVIYVSFLLQRKTGNLTFILADKYRSSMAAKDEEVILELIGMWYKEGRYQEVQDICDRLLKRDPDNNVVKLFKAHASDKLAE
jgi:RsiW-degrading membrane proteinase PrsW (M82 family)